jgi:hypothetical protein
MAFERSQMLYDNGYYKWSARADHDNPYYRQGTDYSQINKTEGYEVLYFLNHLGKKRWNPEPNTTTYQKMERILRYYVPAKSTHKKAEDFIVNNWNNY